jgi:high-affinity Fe2+/Pb2+ permease
VQQRYGFSPLFITTTILYLIAVGVMWKMFHDAEQRQAAAMQGDEAATRS